jgi:hypothetical protein
LQERLAFCLLSILLLLEVQVEEATLEVVVELVVIGHLYMQKVLAVVQLQSRHLFQ